MNKNIFEILHSGCVVKIRFFFYEKILEYVGVCVSKHMKSRKLILRNFIVNTSIDYVFFLNAPNVIDVLVLEYPHVRVKKSKAFFLKGKFKKKYISGNY